MAVLIEAISVVINTQALSKAFKRGDEFEAVVPTRAWCADNELIAVAFMMPQDAEAFIQKLESLGLSHLDHNNEADDIVVVDQARGPMSTCRWAEFGHVSIDGNQVAAGRLSGSENHQLVTPPHWVYERSLSSSYGFVPADQVDKSLEYLRHENGVDVYLSKLTGEEVYIGRTGET